MSQESDPEAMNPYASPHSFPAIASSPAVSGRPVYQLYSIGAVVLATFLGSLFAGGLLMAIDFRRLGRIGAARTCLAIAVVCQFLVFGLAWLLPDNAPNMLVLLPQLVVMYLVAEQCLGSKLLAHELAGGKNASLWKAAGIGLACCVLYLGAGFVVLIGLELLAPGSLEQ